MVITCTETQRLINSMKAKFCRSLWPMVMDLFLFLLTVRMRLLSQLEEVGCSIQCSCVMIHGIIHLDKLETLNLSKDRLFSQIEKTVNSTHSVNTEIMNGKNQDKELYHAQALKLIWKINTPSNSITSQWPNSHIGETSLTFNQFLKITTVVMEEPEDYHQFSLCQVALDYILDNLLSTMLTPDTIRQIFSN